MGKKSPCCSFCGARPNQCVIACLHARESARREEELHALEQAIEDSERGVVQLEFEGDLEVQRTLVRRFMTSVPARWHVEVIEPDPDSPCYLVNLARTRAGLGGPLDCVYEVSENGFKRSQAHDDFMRFIQQEIEQGRLVPPDIERST